MPPGPKNIIIGASAAEGVALGAVLILPVTPPHGAADSPAAAALTLQDYHEARRKTVEQLNGFQQRIEGRIEETVSALFRAHLAILDDPGLEAHIRERVGKGEAVCEAITATFGRYIQTLAHSASSSFREKTQDLIDICRRLLANLCGGRSEITCDMQGRILLVDELLPSDLLRTIAQRVEGLILTSGGTTAHISMLARSLRVPIVLARPETVQALTEGTRVLLDANQGIILVEPDERVVAAYAALLELQAKPVAPMGANRTPTRTGDGRHICLQANVSLLSEITVARAVNAEGIGLYRSEIPFLVRDDLPTEAEQLRIYQRLLDGMGGLPVVFRSLDIGGDKLLSYFPLHEQANPSLGLRGIRFLLKHQDVLRTQLRAMLRAGHGHELKIMFPLVSSVDSFLAIKDIVADCIRDLEREKIPCSPRPQLGVMVELPSAVGVIEELAEAADFLSIGTNDLTQHILAVDRANQSVSAWYIPYHPAVLRAIKRIVVAAARHGRPLSLCGDIASEPALLPVLIGMGLTTLSVSPFSFPRVQELILGIDARAAEHKAAEVLAYGRVAEIRSALGIPSTQGSLY